MVTAVKQRVLGRPQPVTAQARLPRISLARGLWRYRTDRLELLRELAAERSDIVESSLGPLSVAMITNADYAYSVLVEQNDAFRKGPALDRHARPLLGNGLLSSYGDEHRRQRKALAPRFQPRHIANYLDTMAEETERMLARWRERAPEDFAAEMGELTLRIAARTMFGASIEAHIPLIREVLELALRYVMEESTTVVHVPFSWPTRRNRELSRAISALDALVYQMIAERRAAPSATSDVLSALLDAQAENGVSDERVRDEVITFFMAGHETTATALSWCYVFLAEAPEVAHDLALEAERVLGAGLGWRDTIKSLELTSRVLSEVLRMAPPLYMMSRQALRDVAVGPYVLRRGSYALINILGMHHREDYFSDPDVFRPERFLGEPTWPRHAYLPFGAGPRVCIGKHFATMEGTLILALLARSVDFHKGWEHTIAPDPMLTLRPLEGVPFRPHWRS